jgi:lipopolysaccharide transport system ATP-binding protein
MSYNSPVIELSQVSKYFLADKKPLSVLKSLITGAVPADKRFYALNNISFAINSGMTVGIIGRNGSGKSTLLQLVTGTMFPSKGKLRVSGKVAALLELGSGFNPEFTGAENVRLSASIYGLSQTQIKEKFDAIIDFSGIGDKINQPVKTYSSGMFVRLSFSVIAHVDADVLIIDEALSVGDVVFNQKCMRFLNEFKKQGTILFVSHDLASVKALCDKVIWLHDGKILMQGEPDLVCGAYTQAAYDSIALEKEKTRYPLSNRSALDSLASRSFGLGKATISNVQVLTSENRNIISTSGGELVCCVINVVVHEEIQSPIVGFFIKDRFGQALFGDNTLSSSKIFSLNPGQNITVEFEFIMPRLPSGEYVVTAAVAEGDQNDHVQHHWVHDAFVFKSEYKGGRGGLVGILMEDIRYKIVSS